VRWSNARQRRAWAVLHKFLGDAGVKVAGKRHLPLGVRRQAAKLARSAPVGRLRLRSGIEVDHLVELAASPRSRTLLLARPEGSFASLVALVDDEALVPLGRHLFGSDQWDPLEQSTAIYQAVILDQVTTPRPAFRACLLAITTIARRLERTHQHSLFKRCITILRAPINPYEAKSLVFAARSAAVALLVSDSSLDQILLDEIRQRPERIEPLLDVVGGAVRSRDVDRPADLLAAVLEVWKPGEDRAIGFGDLCDTGFSAGDPVLGRPRPPRTHPRLVWIGRRLMPPLLGLLLGLVVFGLSKVPSLVLPTGLIVNPGVALGALALLLATHVVSAQLAAERLPGSLARFSSQPRGVVNGYSAGFAMVAASLIAVRAPHNPLWLQIATVELAAFAVSLVATLIALVRRTDSTTAAVGFARDQKLRFQTSGERMGSIQAASLLAQKELESLPWARYGGSNPLSQRREPLRAAKQGFTELRLDRLQALGERPPWKRRDFVLHVGGGLGTLVHRDQELASIIPGREVRLLPGERNRAASVFRVRSELAVEESAESLAALTKLAGDLAAEGNPGGASRVSDALIGLLGEHLEACHTARGETSDDEADEVFPVNLALQMVLTVAVRGVGEAKTGVERRTLGAIVARALALSRAGDGGVTMALSALPGPGERKLNSEELDVIWEAGERALHFKGSAATGYVNSVLQKWMKAQKAGVPTPLEIASRLTILHVWVNQLSADARWEWFWEQTEPYADTEDRRLAMIRIGAAALLSGCASVAVRIALAVRQENLDGLKTYLHRREVSAWESFLSQQYGYLLGTDPEEAMMDFLGFAERVHLAVPDPNVGAPHAQQ
jgi:hypothetical protein